MSRKGAGNRRRAGNPGRAGIGRGELLALLGLAALVAPATARAQMDPGMSMGQGPGPARGAAPDDIIPEVDEKVAKDPQKVRELADRYFEKQDWMDAIAHYQVLRNRYSWNLQQAAHAELRLADIAFAREKWADARAQYRTFARLHPGSEMVDYAAFRAGLATFRDLPGGGWITPPPEEKDQSEAQEAMRQLRDFLRDYPKSAYVDEARKTIVECENRLAAHEMYVARYYAKRDKWRGTLLRAQTVVERYPESDLVPEALVLCVQAHAALKQGDEAKKALARLQERSPAPDPALVSRAQKAVEGL